MKGMLVSFFLLFFPSWAAAGALPEDFAYGLPLLLKENAAVYRLLLPEEVYGAACTEDLSDIRVFNGEKSPVPQVLRRPETEEKISEETTPLPFFPLYRSGTETGDLSLHIEKREDGTIIDLKPEAAPHGAQLIGCIIDASKAAGRIDALDIAWAADAGDFVATVALEYSNDLVHWAPLVPEAGLARMRYGDQEIHEKRIPLPAGISLARCFRSRWKRYGPRPQDGQGLAAANISDSCGHPEAAVSMCGE